MYVCISTYVYIYIYIYICTFIFSFCRYRCPVIWRFVGSSSAMYVWSSCLAMVCGVDVPQETALFAGFWLTIFISRLVHGPTVDTTTTSFSVHDVYFFYNRNTDTPLDAIKHLKPGIGVCASSWWSTSGLRVVIWLIVYFELANLTGDWLAGRWQWVTRCVPETACQSAASLANSAGDVGWLAGWLADWLTGWLAGWLSGWLVLAASLEAEVSHAQSSGGDISFQKKSRGEQMLLRARTCIGVYVGACGFDTCTRMPLTFGKWLYLWRCLVPWTSYPKILWFQRGSVCSWRGDRRTGQAAGGGSGSLRSLLPPCQSRL